MKKMSVEEAAKYFGVSKEAIHNRVRRGSLESVVEEGIKKVLIDENAKTAQKRSAASKPQGAERYYRLLEEQNAKLQARVEHLENETRSLRDQKEQMLIAEREKLERIYKEKDEQLKNILQTIASKFMLEAPIEAIEEEAIEAEIESVSVQGDIKDSELISLKKYLKTLEISDKKRKKIMKRFEALEDERVVRVGKKIYIDVVRYSYDDLL